MTNDQLAARLGVSRSMASRVRSGQRLPSVRTMYAIHAEFGLSLDELVAAHIQGSAKFSALLRAKLDENESVS